MRQKTPIRPGSQTRRFLRGAGFAVFAAAIFALGMKANPGLVVTDLNHGVTPADLANALVGSGVTISNVTYVGNARAAGTFSGATSLIGFPSGVILGSGAVQTAAGDVPCSQGVEGPNDCHEFLDVAWSNSTDFANPGDADLTALSGYETFDAAVLEFDFVPQFSNLQFKYVFSSEEYSDYSNTQFNDVFAFYVNGSNCALVPLTGEPVDVDTINNGNDIPGLDPTPHHPELFRDNVNPTPTLDTQMDGLTVVLTCAATVNPGQTNHMKLAVADASDHIFDTAVFIKTGSLVSGTVITTSLSGGGQTGEEITVETGVPVRDSSILKGGNAASAGGTVAYSVFSDEDCKVPFASAGTKTVVNGIVPDSDAVTFARYGTYYWIATYSGDGQNNPSSSDCGEEKVTVSGVSSRELTALGPARVFVGLSNSDDVGLYFDLRAEALVSGAVVGFGQADRVWGGSSGFNNARKTNIPLTLTAPVPFPSGGELALRVFVRQACTAPQERHCPSANACKARLWFNDGQANSSFGAGIEEVDGGQVLDYFLFNNFLLGPAAGPGPKKTVDVGAGKRCSDFKPFGTWKMTIGD